ncbi:response regulator transcription factor [Devosia sp. ZB163]|uniref:response regulator transcription factor n=1 Tax=Devosia sp. ZB163 TaxID=3025938 RepID=UPI0023616502|nr:response regulator transcription factor [Devosia sp. ZB163]MDC9822769.1 response regulator transcription factor [Devosia sp. ZB163]
MRLLLVEDDEMLGQAIRDHLVAHGHAADWTRRLDDADAAQLAVAYDAMLLDLNLPDGRGMEFLKRLRRRGDTTPVIIVTAMDQLTMRIEGLNAGADDYLVKPFDLGELLARVGAVGRRYAGNPNPLIVVGPLELDPPHKLATVNGRKLDLSAREWAVLERLAQHPGTLVSRMQLEEALFGFGDEIESNAVEVYVSRLRKKLDAGVIHTVRGLGYRLAPQ